MTVERNNMATAKAAAVSYPYIEDVFSTYLYKGNGSTQTITNNIDLSTKGGMIWFKARDITYSYALNDTVRGINSTIQSNTTAGAIGGLAYSDIASFNTNGFSLNYTTGLSNDNGFNYASWTFREQPKFFDIVTYTGNGANRTISHNLGSTPGMIIVKRTDTTSDWVVYHSALTSASYYIYLNLPNAQGSNSTIWNATAPTSSVFSVGNSPIANTNGGTYIAYLFASNAGGFGSTGTDNVITCGSYTGNGSVNGPTITLGYEPQYILIKMLDGNNPWNIFDTMRGIATGGNDAWLRANLSNAESNSLNWLSVTATGFQITADYSEVNSSSQPYIYMAIRRGPMKTPTSGTSVFTPIARTGTGAATTITSGFVVDAVIEKSRIWSAGPYEWSRLQGPNSFLITSAAAAQNTSYTDVLTSFANNTGINVGADASLAAINNSNALFNSYINWMFSRAPGFFDVVCYTGNGSSQALNHNLTVVPELIIIHGRNIADDWYVWSTSLGTSCLKLNSTAVGPFGGSTSNYTTTEFTVSTSGSIGINVSASTYIAYLFATLAGVSKVGSYTGTGAAQNIDCGFAAGARFVMIKRTDSAGDWYVYDTARGISASGVNDPYLFMNSSATEVTTTDYLGTFSSGFALTSSAPAAMNANGGTFLYLAIA